VFDADSNLSLDSTRAPVLFAGRALDIGTSSGTGGNYVPGESKCWNMFGIRKYDTIYQPGLRVFDWGYDKANDESADRVVKIRLVGYLPISGKVLGDSAYIGKADTLNSAYNSVEDDGLPTFVAGGASGTEGICITAGPIASMAVAVQKEGSSD